MHPITVFYINFNTFYVHLTDRHSTYSLIGFRRYVSSTCHLDLTIMCTNDRNMLIDKINQNDQLIWLCLVSNACPCRCMLIRFLYSVKIVEGWMTLYTHSTHSNTRSRHIHHYCNSGSLSARPRTANLKLLICKYFFVHGYQVVSTRPIARELIFIKCF